MPMNRREFIATLGSAAALPMAARAQEAGRIYRLGMLIPASQASIAAFFDELRINGFVEGQNLEVIGGYSVRAEQIADGVAAVIKAAPDVVLCGPETYVRALQAATRTIPLDSMSEDLVGEGFAASLAKPGGNITGVSLLSPELDGKRLEILIEAVPGVRRIAALAQSAIATKLHLEEQQTLARSRGVELSVVLFAKAEDIGPALDEAKARGAQAINFLATPLQVVSRDLILDQMSRIRLPAIYQWPETPEYGGLLGYGPLFVQMYRQRARQVVKMLRGAKPADVPVEQPANFQLAVNLKTAKAIGQELSGRAGAARRQGDRMSRCRFSQGSIAHDSNSPRGRPRAAFCLNIRRLKISSRHED
jgi:putative tryptophan/tyrosine transport system substrate-binding protein